MKLSKFVHGLTEIIFIGLFDIINININYIYRLGICLYFYVYIYMCMFNGNKNISYTTLYLNIYSNTVIVNHLY